MRKEQFTDMIYILQAQYSSEASELLKKIGLAVLTGDSQTMSEDALDAARKQSKVDVLEELLEQLEQEE
ncbi:MAG TPA: hypothetical protein VHV10_02715 [Ktedonobacteraceae bacterium]|jgi:hypothetical protein|nr:hypothetical protein [Ktedonobacteraceae bacterium]